MLVLCLVMPVPLPTACRVSNSSWELYIWKYNLDYGDDWPFEIMVGCDYYVEENVPFFSILHFRVSSCNADHIEHSWWLLTDFSLKRSRKFQADERLFSLSSVTSPAVRALLLNVAEWHTASNYSFPMAFQSLEFVNFCYLFLCIYRSMNIWLDEMVSFLKFPSWLKFKSMVPKKAHFNFQYLYNPGRWKRVWSRSFKGWKHSCKWAVSFQIQFLQWFYEVR